jgi:hypothetical protein
VVLLVVARQWLERVLGVPRQQVKQVERGLIAGIAAVLRDRVGQHQAPEPAAGRDSRLIEPVGHRHEVETLTLRGKGVVPLRPRRELVGVLEDGVADLAPVIVGLGVGVRVAVEPVDLLTRGQVAAVDDLLP